MRRQADVTHRDLEPGNQRRVFADLNLEGVERERLVTIGDVCAGPGSLCANHAFEVTSESIVDAMIAADALGEERKALADLF